MSADRREAFRLWINELPLSRELGLLCTEIGPRGARGEVRARDAQRNPDGNISGALIAAAVDIIGGIGVTAASDGLGSATADLTVHFLAPARVDPLSFEVEVLRQGRRTCVPHIRVHDANGRLCVVATGTWMLRDTPVAIDELRSADHDDRAETAAAARPAR
ncbi:PaaI family thioesterase [Microbacterium sp. NPDC055910]|uniref:PaaI family thioesterase n=1 Tax=Microbacterium sp. NPDC055910 TaxID=3345659 RepID=UPI0035D575E3